MQQGRVILDRDFNALQETLIGATEADALDMIGPCGTPDDGFAISTSAFSLPGSVVWTPPPPLSPPAPRAFDFLISPGTMYVGGLRAVFPAADSGQPPFTYSYFYQPDFIDPIDPTAPVGGSLPVTPIHEFVYLYLSEQEVSAVEDPDLKDVALGAPDTTQRIRLMRRVERISVNATTCGPALTEAKNAWRNRGFLFDPDTMRLVPQATLQVSFTQSQTISDPCDPVAQGGYLGAENQLIRVQISEGGNDADSQAKLLWGYDNASFIYRVSINVDGKTLQLNQSPVDAFHTPQLGQVVEVLRTAAVLSSEPDETDPLHLRSIVRCVAESTGVVRTLTSSYNPDDRRIVLDQPLPLEYLVANTPLFVRIWQAQLDFDPTAGTPVILTNASGQVSSGVQVTIGGPKNGKMPRGAYWMLAVRPSTPQAVYPERFLLAAQPPDGPRQWVCPLAVIDWTAGGLGTNTSPPIVQPTVVDCRQLFNNLVELANRLVTQVLGRGIYGQDIVLRNGDTVTGSDLARGLRVLLNRNIDPTSATGAACFVNMELPFVVAQQAVGFQPVVLAANIVANDSTMIAWNPVPNTQQYLANQLPHNTLTGGSESFATDWDIFPPATTAADWHYVLTGAEASVSSTDQNAFAGFMAINKRPLKDSAVRLEMSGAPPGVMNQPSYVGLVFNFSGFDDFWALTLSAFATSSFSAGFTGYVAFSSITHYVNGAVARTADGSLESATGSSEFAIMNAFERIDFQITQSDAQLAFVAQLTTVNSSQVRKFDVSLSSAPKQLLSGSRVGLITNWNGQATFSRLRIAYPTGTFQTLLPPGVGRLLSRLTVKRDFLQLTDGTAGAAMQRSPFPPPRPDFSMWFWVQPSEPGGPYDFFTSGIGTHLL
jgi:hypothetical protein